MVSDFATGWKRAITPEWHIWLATRNCNQIQPTCSKARAASLRWQSAIRPKPNQVPADALPVTRGAKITTTSSKRDCACLSQNWNESWDAALMRDHLSTQFLCWNAPQPDVQVSGFRART